MFSFRESKSHGQHGCCIDRGCFAALISLFIPVCLGYDKHTEFTIVAHIAGAFTRTNNWWNMHVVTDCI